MPSEGTRCRSWGWTEGEAADWGRCWKRLRAGSGTQPGQSGTKPGTQRSLECAAECLLFPAHQQHCRSCAQSQGCWGRWVSRECSGCRTPGGLELVVAEMRQCFTVSLDKWDSETWGSVSQSVWTNETVFQVQSGQMRQCFRCSLDKWDSVSGAV